MDKRLTLKSVTFYLWVAAAYFVLAVLTTVGKYPTQVVSVLVNNAWAVTYVTLLNFIFFEYTVPFVLRRRKVIILTIILGAVLLFLHMILYSYGSYLWRLLGIQLHVYTPLRQFASLGQLLENQMAYSVGSVFLFGVTRHSYNYIKLRQATQQLRIEKQAAELNYLKSQTNPHFLFNTLNNIYSLARDKSDLAPEAILRLSKILRYMLYETGGEYIAIEQELKVITDYIDLERLRYDDTLRVNFNHDVEDMRQGLPPLLLIPLVENAFKHGVSETRGVPFVDIHLSIRNRHLLFAVKNSSEGAADEVVKENIGLSNLRRQLELLYTDYNISAKQDEGMFIATLKINLSSHA